MLNIKFKRVFGGQAIDAHVNKSITEIENVAKVEIELAAQSNINPVSILISICASFRSLKDSVESYFLPLIKEAEIKTAERSLDSNKSDLSKEVVQINKAISAITLDIKRTLAKFPFRNRKLVIAGIISGVGIDAILTASALQVILSDLLFSIGLAIMIAVLLAVLIQQASFQINNATKRYPKLIWVCGVFLGCGALFYFLAIIRNKYYSEQEEMLSMPMIWTLFSLFFLSISFILAVNLTPNKKQVEANNYIKEKKLEIRILEKQRQNVCEKITKIEVETSDWVSRELLLKSDLGNLLQLIQSECQRVCLGCINDYILKGGTYPPSDLFNEFKKIKS